jgi:N-acetylglucosaminyldiphosphoundecaprenol N-acetyl-beta-D-mannosaminyltransferase
MTAARSGLVRSEAFGIHVDGGTVADFVEWVDTTIARGERCEVFYHNLHSLYLCQRDPAIRALYRNAVVLVDGMPVVWLFRLAGMPVRRHHRVTWMDLVWPLLARARDGGRRVFWVGNAPEVLAAGLAAVRRRLPELAIDGYPGFFDAGRGSDDSRNLVSRINRFAADLCIVGMGTPRQEQWVVDHRAAITAPAVLVSGACLEYIAGTVPTPPRWLGPLGLEWIARLAADPRRFARRYLVEPWLLLALLAVRSPSRDDAARGRGIADHG